MAKYIIKIYDPLHNCYGYCVKGVLIPMGKIGWFYDDSVFDSKNKAKRHIQKMLRNKPRWLRPEINYSYFEIVQLIEYRSFGFTTYYTPDTWENYTNKFPYMKADRVRWR